MHYEYTLSKRDSKKYGFTHLICNGWFGIQADQFNEKWLCEKDSNNGKRITINLSDADITRITKNAKNYKEF